MLSALRLVCDNTPAVPGIGSLGLLLRFSLLGCSQSYLFRIARRTDPIGTVGIDEFRVDLSAARRLSVLNFHPARACATTLPEEAKAAPL